MYQNFYQKRLFKAVGFRLPLPFTLFSSSWWKMLGMVLQTRQFQPITCTPHRTASLVVMMTFQGLFAMAQDQVKGVILDQRDGPIAGATVVVKGTSDYAISGPDGSFEINAIEERPFMLVVKFVGYKAQEVQVTGQSDLLEVVLTEDGLLEEIVVTSRRRTESAQDVPIPVSIVSGELISDRGTFNVNLLKELIPSVQLYASNPRNTTLNIRGMGSTFGLTNDGIDPGVGFYVDGVYYARPAAASLDFIDIERVEVLRGPQGTLFGKNTTAGAFNII